MVHYRLLRLKRAAAARGRRRDRFGTAGPGFVGGRRYCAVVNDERGGRELEEFERIALIAQVEKDRAMITQYLQNMAFFQTRIEDARYRLGRLEERLGG